MRPEKNGLSSTASQSKPAGRISPSCDRKTAHQYAVTLLEPLLGDDASGHTHGGFARRRTTAAARIANAVLLPIGVVRMAGTELLGDVAVVLAALISVADQQADRRAGGTAFVHAGQNLDLVGLATRRGVPALAAGTALQIMAELFRRDLQAGRAAIDDAADRRPVRFAEGGDGEQLAERIGTHARRLIAARPARRCVRRVRSIRGIPPRKMPICPTLNSTQPGPLPAAT